MKITNTIDCPNSGAITSIAHTGADTHPVVATGAGGSVYILSDNGTIEVTSQFRASSYPIVGMSASGATIIVGAMDGTVSVWALSGDGGAFDKVCETTLDAPVTQAGIACAGTATIIAATDSSIFLLTAVDGDFKQLCKIPAVPAEEEADSPARGTAHSLALIGSTLSWITGQAVRVASVSGGALIAPRVVAMMDTPVVASALAPDGSLLACMDSNGTVALVDVCGATTLYTIPPAEDATSLAGGFCGLLFNPCRYALFIATGSGVVNTLDLETKTYGRSFSGTKNITAFAATAAGDRLLVGDGTGDSCRYFDVASGDAEENNEE